MTLDVTTLADAPDARARCIEWTHSEWGPESGYSPEDWEREFDRIEAHPTDEIFVAKEDGRAVGMVWLLEREEIELQSVLSPWLSSLIVAPDCRDRGIATALMDHLEHYVAASGDDRLYLLTETPPYYFAKGWEVVDTAPFRNRSVFVMTKFIGGTLVLKNNVLMLNEQMRARALR